MTAYMVILAEINDPQGFREYATQAAKLVAEFGGEYIVMGDSDLLEGTWPDETRTVVSKWPSKAQAEAFWHSPRYAEIKKLRDGKATVRVRLFGG